MKLLVALAALQTVLVAVLLFRSFSGDSTPALPAVAGVPVAHDAAYAPHAADEARLRQVIREELARHAGENGAPSVPAQRDAAADRDRAEAVERQINHYRSAGAIPEAGLAELHAEIARLDPDRRSEMLRKLARAMNTGEIKGQLH